jgi:hypothetical protein
VKRGLRELLVAGATLAVVVSCSIGDVDFDGKACPCGAGYVCDASRNLCVRPGAGGVDAGNVPDSSGPGLSPDSGGGGACAGDNCPCTKDADCVDPTRSRCSPAKVCVECVPTATPDTCGAGTYCNAANECTLGCKAESDCVISPSAPHCDTQRHQCVACRTLADCTGADQCSPAGECVQGCDIAAGKLCPSGKACCDNLCIDTKTDVLNCGGCGMACSTANGTPSCAASACSWSCANGFGHCGTGNTGCETNLRTSVTHCGSCTKDCNGSVSNANGLTCAGGNCGYTSCKTGFADCNGNAQDGCDCACGQAKNQPCCPGGVCNFSGGNCNAANKCI